MSLALKYPHIEKLEGQPARLERLPRVRVAQIAMDYREHGWSVDEMCHQHTYLTLAEAHAAMAYYFDHQAEVEQEILDEIEQVEREQLHFPHSPIYYRLRV
ncbi:MAG TPA: DUF433 domain-containing protein [Isosphaeraceae bacterium]|nr:DUF433 domain-containing protein [Isosphaeraceae bacterium]